MNKQRPFPPKLAEWLLSRVVDPDIRYSALGDFEEQFRYQVNDDGLLKATLWYWLQAVRSLPKFVTDSFYWSAVMFKNYLKVAIRNLLKYRVYSFINISGLAVGIASAVVILLWVQNELSYDRFHSQANRIYRVVRDFEQAGQLRQIATTPIPLATVMKRDLPEVEDAVRLLPGQYMVSYQEKALSSQDVFFADASFFNLFDFSLVRGDPEQALANPNTVVMTESKARLYFGDEDPMGKTLVIENDETFEVTGVIEDPPNNSHFHFDFLVSFVSLGIDETQSFRWRNSINYYTYVLLGSGHDPQLLGDPIENLHRKYSPGGKARVAWHLQPLASIHLHSDRENEIEPNGNAATIYILSAIALFILFIASINFINLTTARSAQRAKEIGIRKVLGAYRMTLMRQFLGESILVALLALILAFGLVTLLEPYISSFAGTQLLASGIELWKSFVYFLMLALGVGLVAGIYPALFLSGFQPASSLGKAHKTGTVGLVLRKGLVVFQFFISVILIVGTVMIYQQLQFVVNKRLGFQKEQILVLNLHSELRQSYESFKRELLERSGALAASALYRMPGERAAMNTFHPEGVSDDNYPSFKTLYVDHDFLQTMGIELAAGRDFSKDFTTDASEAFVLNESAVKMLGWRDPIGKRLGWWNRDGQVIGVVRDFHFASLHQEIEPLVMFIFPDLFRRMAVRTSPINLPQTLADIEETWKAFAPSRPFEYSFLDQNFGQLYEADQEFGKVCGLFSILACFIACLGLFGLAAFSVEQRTREIGIRKVLGVSVSGLIFLLSREFTQLVIVALVIASPVAYLAINRWLQDFAYHVDFSIWPYLLSAGLTFFVALVTVGTRTIKAALANPTDSLNVE